MSVPASEIQQKIVKNFTTAEILAYEQKRRPSVWAQVNTRLKGEPFRFSTPDGKQLQLQREFLKQPLDDQHPHKTTQKARQLGLSENGVRESLWFADMHDFTKQVYTFPTDGQVKDFSRTRIKEVIDDSPYLTRRMGIDPHTKKRINHLEEIVDNVKLKKIGKSYIFFRSGATPKAGEGIDCDVVYFDEIDRMHPNVTIAFNETLSSSPYGWRRDISTPSLPGVGVNASFQKSDQQHWFMKCPFCGEYFTLILEFPRCIIDIPKTWYNKYPNLYDRDKDKKAYICVKCNSPVDNETKMKGFWYPLYKHKKDIRGYQLTQLVAPWISATRVMQKKEDYKVEQLFVNYVIGLTYLGDNILLTKHDIERCIDYTIDDPVKLNIKNVVIGGDWGNESWQIAGMKHPNNKDLWVILDLFKISDTDKIGNENPHIKYSTQFFKKWRAKLGIYDAGYGKDRNFDLLKTFPGKIFSCFYPNNFTDYTKDFEDRWDEDGHRLSVDRTMSLKLVAHKFVSGEVVIPKWVAESPLFPTFVKHLTNLVSVKDIDEQIDGGEKITERIGSLPGGDHFAHACLYMFAGLRLGSNAPKSDFWMPT